jgi:hypothetical protein
VTQRTIRAVDLFCNAVSVRTAKALCAEALA